MRPRTVAARPRAEAPAPEPSLTTRIVEVLRRIPRGKVASYGQIAALAGSPRGARQVVRVLHALSEKKGLPWHRVVNVAGRISLPPGGGFELQRAMLRKDAVAVSADGRIDLARHGWRPRAR
jgi:methylated-DNA-protein-cysteine methyltransferase-like protein